MSGVLEWIHRVKDWLFALIDQFAASPHPGWWLFALAVAESSFFPIPPDVLLVTLGVARPEMAIWYAVITSVGSVLGGPGASTLNIDEGTLDVGGDLTVDSLRVGYAAGAVGHNRSATVTVAGGGAVTVGSAANRTNLYVGRMTANLTEHVGQSGVRGLTLQHFQRPQQGHAASQQVG